MMAYLQVVALTSVLKPLFNSKCQQNFNNCCSIDRQRVVGEMNTYCSSRTEQGPSLPQKTWKAVVNAWALFRATLDNFLLYSLLLTQAQEQLMMRCVDFCVCFLFFNVCCADPHPLTPVGSEVCRTKQTILKTEWDTSENIIYCTHHPCKSWKMHLHQLNPQTTQNITRKLVSSCFLFTGHRSLAVEEKVEMQRHNWIYTAEQEPIFIQQMWESSFVCTKSDCF